MTKEEKQIYKSKKTLGYWSACGGIEVKDIISSIEDYAIVEINTFAGKPSMHRLKIHYPASDISPYIVVAGHRYNFDECIKN